ncbi:MAG: nucleotidyltransferase family protein [Caldilineae bacterium]|nr:MAG: nucleotidyltransferase family protein [Caldilineae bacterium]
MKAVVLAGGKGTRLAPYTKILPKPLMPIGDMPILEILLRQMKWAGIEEVILTVGYLEELFRAFFKDGARYGLRIRYSFEDHPLGTAGPLSLIDDLHETFLVCNGDILTTLDMKQLVDYHRANGATATIAMHSRQVKIDLGVLKLNGSCEIIGIQEKPTYDFQVSMGIYVFEPRVLDYIPYNQYLDFPDLVTELLAHGERVIGYPFKGYWQDLGSPADYEQAVEDFEQIRHKILRA